MASCIVFVESHSSGVAENLKAFRHISPDFQYWISVSKFNISSFFCAVINSTPKQIILIVTIIGHDLVQMVVLSSYAVQCYLLRYYLYILNDKLIQNTIEPIDWMRVRLICNLNDF